MWILKPRWQTTKGNKFQSLNLNTKFYKNHASFVKIWNATLTFVENNTWLTLMRFDPK